MAEVNASLVYFFIRPSKSLLMDPGCFLGPPSSPASHIVTGHLSPPMASLSTHVIKPLKSRSVALTSPSSDISSLSTGRRTLNFPGQKLDMNRTEIHLPTSTPDIMLLTTSYETTSSWVLSWHPIYSQIHLFMEYLLRSRLTIRALIIELPTYFPSF